MKTQELNDALYFIKADEIFKRHVNDGFSEVLKIRLARADGTIDETSVPVKRVAPEDIDDIVINPFTGEKYTAEDVPNSWKLFKPVGGWKVGNRVAKYIGVEQPELRRLYHSDVLGYNPGGPRAYDNVNYFIKQEQTVTLLSGKEVPSTPRTILGTFSRSEAEFVAKELTEIMKAAFELAPGIRRAKTVSDAFDLLETIADDLDEIVLLNNTFNTNLETGKDFVKFLRDQGLDPRQPFGVAHKDEMLATLRDDGELWFPFTGKGKGTYGDIFSMYLNPPRNAPRRATPLVGIDNEQLQTISPLDTIQSDFLRLMFAEAYAAFEFQAVNGWLKGAERFIKNRKDLIGLNPREAMNAADFGPNPSKEALDFIAARNGINRILRTKTNYELKWNAFVDRVAEWVYEKGHKKAAIEIMKRSKKPVEFLRGWAFDARLGLGAIDQLIIQSAQVANIFIIVSPMDKLRFLKIAATHLPIRLALEATSEETVRAIARRSRLFTGMDEEEFMNFYRWVKDSGRLNVGGEVAEISETVNPTLVTGLGTRLRYGLRFFFNEGEKFPRTVAIRVAWDEYKKKFPKGDPFSEHGINWIMTRQDALTAAMTGVSAAPWQRNMLSIPFQFMTYITRMMESIFTDRLLTKKERLRLFFYQFGLWGLSGYGANYAFDKWIIENNIEMNRADYALLKYGVLDAIITTVFGTQTAFASRLAPGAGIIDFIRNWNDSNFVEIVGGPAFSLMRDVGLVTTQTLMDALSGNMSMNEANLRKLFRQISSANRMYQSWMIYKYGDYYSRNDDLVVSGLTKTDAIFNLLGARIQDVEFTYGRIDVMKNQNEHLKETSKRIAEIMKEMTRALENDDFEKANDLAEMIGMYTAPLAPWELERVLKGLDPVFIPLMDRLIKAEYKRAQGKIKEALEQEGEQ